MNILIISHTLPNTPSKDGMTLILYNVLRYLAPDHVYTVLALDQYDDGDALFSEIRTTIDKYDVIYVHGPQTLQLLPQLTQYPNIVVGLIDTQSYKFQQLAAQETNVLQRRKWHKQQIAWEVFERDVLSKVNYIIVGTEPDKAALMKNVSGKPFISVIPNGVDSDYFAPNETIEQELAVIFSGVIDQPSNTQSILYFYKHIWPHITKQEEYTKLRWYIVGKQPTKKITTLQHKDKRIIVTGFVPEVKDFLVRSLLFVSPIHLRSGIRNTVLEAMACALPVVAFADACAGLEASPIRKVNTDTDFANTVIHLLEDSEQRAQVGAASRKYIQHHHSWAQHTKQYEQILEQASHN